MNNASMFIKFIWKEQIPFKTNIINKTNLFINR